MKLTIYGDIEGNIIEKVESESTIIGIDERSVIMNWGNEKLIEQIVKELETLKKEVSGKVSEEELRNINDALSAIKEKNESKLITALKCIGRETLNVTEGITGSILASMIMQIF